MASSLAAAVCRVGEHVVEVKPVQANRLDSESVLRWLLEAPASEAESVLEAVTKQRGDLRRRGSKPAAVLHAMLAGDLPASHAEQPEPSESVGVASAGYSKQLLLGWDRRAEDAVAARKEKPLVQFSTAMYFCAEDEGQIMLEVMRIGDSQGVSEVDYTTKDRSAKAGVRYRKTSGRLVFQPGEIEKTISVPIIASDEWSTSTEFCVELLRDNPLPVNATLGRYLWIARVKIIDNDVFPSSKFKTQILEDTVDNTSEWGILMEYFKLNWADTIIKVGSIKMIAVDMMHNCYLLLKLFLNVFLVDRILSPQDRVDEPSIALACIAVLLIVIGALLHVLDYREPTWKVAGASRGRLQKDLLHKFLNYSEQSRSALQPSWLTMAVTRDVTGMVHNGYMNALKLVGLIGKLVSILIFHILAPFVFEHPAAAEGFAVLAIFPLVLLTVLKLRNPYTTPYMHRKDDAQDTLVQHTVHAVENFRVIADYCRRPFFVDLFAGHIKQYNLAFIACDQVLLNNKYAAIWFTILVEAAYTVWGGMSVISGSESLGMFLANIQIIAQVGSCCSCIYSALLDLQRVLPELYSVTRLMNMQTDLMQRRALNAETREMTRKLRAELTAGACMGLPLDYLPIMVNNPTYKFTSKDGDGQTTFECTGKLEMQQGQMTVLMGPRGEGKSTLLKVISGVVLPEPGGVFVPSHLRVFHISSDPMFFEGNLYTNLTFGVAPGDPDGDPQRVQRILRRLALPAEVVSMATPENNQASFSHTLSLTQRSLLSLARALITNPEVLCLHKPTMAFDEVTAERVLRLLKEFCMLKGVDQDEETRHLRRPRTCIITTSAVTGVELADLIYLVSRKDGVKLISKDDLQLDEVHNWRVVKMSI